MEISARNLSHLSPTPFSFPLPLREGGGESRGNVDIAFLGRTKASSSPPTKSGGEVSIISRVSVLDKCPLKFLLISKGKSQVGAF